MRSLRPCLLLALVAATAAAQSPTERGAILIMRGTDTLVSDRFIRVADTLEGIVDVLAQPRVEYHASLAGDSVRSLSVAYYRRGSQSTEAPIKLTRVAMHDSTARVETPSGTMRVPTKVGAIPMFANALALTELFTRQAASTGGVADIPYFSLAGLVTLSVTVRPAPGDTETFSMIQQVDRLKVDPVGRIIGGMIQGTKLRFVRGGPELAAGLHFASTDSATPEKRP